MSWQTEVDMGFIEAAGLNQKPEFVQHMLNAIHVSYYKYGTIRTKTPADLQRYKDAEIEAFQKTGNHERLVNIANYCMFLFMLEGRSEYFHDARHCMEMFEEEKYQATDSNQSVTRIRKTVSEWLREKVYEGAGIN